MNEQFILAHRQIAEKRFNELRQQKADIDTEMIKLQGEYRAYDSLIAQLKESEAEKNATKSKSK